MSLFIDTNVFLRNLVRDNSKQFELVQEFFEICKDKGIDLYTSSIIISEIEWVCRSYYELNRREISILIQSILNAPNLRINNEVDDALSVALFNDSNVKFVDAQIASIEKVQTKEWVIVSFDKHFEKLPVKFFSVEKALRKIRKGN